MIIIVHNLQLSAYLLKSFGWIFFTRLLVSSFTRI